MKRYGHWIGGAEAPPAAGDYLVSTRPGADTVVCEIAAGTPDDVEAAVAAAAGALPSWRDRKPGERGRILTAIADGMRAQAAQLAELESAESGKPAWQSPMEVEGAAAYFDFYAGLAVWYELWRRFNLFPPDYQEGPPSLLDTLLPKAGRGAK